MLVLTRRVGEQIVIAGDICIAVVAVNGRKVRLGITAPSSVPVARLEILTRYSEHAALPTVARNRQKRTGSSSPGTAGESESFPVTH